MIARTRKDLLKAPMAFAAACVGLMAYSFTVGSITGQSACPFLLLSGLPCPGCGGTRAVVELSQGNVGAALAFNAFGLIVLFAGVFLWTRWTLRRSKGQDVPVANFSLTFAVIFAVLAIAWTVFRWTPWYPGTPL